MNLLSLKETLVFIILVLLFKSCNNTANLENEDLGLKLKEQIYFKIAGENEIDNSEGYKLAKKDVLIVLVHGLIIKKYACITYKGFEKIINSFENPENKIKKEILYVKMDDSLKKGFNEQGKEVNARIHRYIKLKNLKKNIRIILIGHSAGGLTCYSAYQQCKKNLNIVGIITVSCPWNGVDVYNIKNKLKWTLRLIIKNYLKIYNENEPGIKDIQVGSEFLEYVKKTLRTCDIPIWAIGGKTDYFSKILSIKAIHNILMPKNKKFNDFLGSTEETDGELPISTQIGEGLESIKKIIITENVHHSLDMRNKMVILTENISKIKGFPISKCDKDNFLSINFEPAILESQEVISKINKFIPFAINKAKMSNKILF